MRLKQLPGQRLSDGDKQATADPLQGTPENQAAQRVAQSAGQRCGAEQREREHNEPASSAALRQPGAEWHDQRQAGNVAITHPGQFTDGGVERPAHTGEGDAGDKHID